MTRPGTKPGSILRINGRFLRACLAGFFAWICWSYTSPVNWGFGLLAAMSATGALAEFIGALLETWQYIHHEWEIYRYLKQGNAPKSDRFVSDDELRKSGRIK
ncbi:hypothetical protein [Roseibium album]|uniref:Uncharacterized protein n=1 Tax=Roseibium album TaxID=311410 RepID=A0A0M6ZTY9_9HYPH|nr:hypothetical protein [Roseibium album]CTQ58146.1 hypothetical protein LA5094_00903 [Roseibium album]CTQ65681.1 hypothetical protein LA5096_00814 [Roseibium album]CTQ70562.1 hypothetical protein LA5095_01958 [Roseibium album]